MDIPEGSNFAEGSKSCTIRRINYIALRNKDWIKARKADGAELRDWPPRAFAESLYELRSKSKV